MRVLVTGASSMIGRKLVRRLLQRGDDVTVVQRRSAGLDDVREHLLDLSSTAAGSEVRSTDDPLLQAMQDQQAVVHLAARVGVSGRWSEYEAINVHGTRRLLDAASRCGVERFVHISTPSVAHAGRSLIGAPAGPAEPAAVRGHYARSKALGEQCVLAANGPGFHVLALRPHLVWGPGDQQLVQRIIDRAQAGRLVLVGSGLALIDTTYVSNAADAIVAAIDRAQQAAGQALVISNGEPRTVKETLQRMLHAAGLSTDLRSVPATAAIAAGSVIERVWDVLDRSGDPPMTRFLAEQLATAHWFDQRHTRRQLAWQPDISLDVGFRTLAKSFAESGSSARTGQQTL